MQRVSVSVTPPYDVVIGPGALTEVDEVLEGRRRVHVVSQNAVWRASAPVLAASSHLKSEASVTHIPQGEAAKTLSTIELLCREFAAGGLLRGDAVLAVGGGVVGDVAGFAAAVYHRGVAVVQVPTTLLAQVDAAIGGKTAVNLPEGKNLIGAFHQPIAVIADTLTLATLPDQELRCGLGEVVKYAVMPGGDAVAAILDRDAARVTARDPDVLAELVASCAGIKAGIVASDPEERTGARAALNYGHTLAHALETVSAHALAHGEAVAIGLVFAANLAHALERVGPEVPARVVALVERVALPIAVPAGTPDARELLAVMQRDKKAKGGITFVLPGPTGLEQVDDPPMHAIDAALRAVGVQT